ncbi:hypothetical protein Q31b_14910 [Novipirellula aureliae]|uniref:Prenyltransferase and squalene oxidase repeat protein n=1 Tax=Novipirellula aureliae TaxID=2527966 RepID=A0A5C6E7M4_9BACT|nr:hypothetical protein [Novipirellula aureliae]TWU43957.1 hypothetical protein Q31b_14910 [Novipirellula aureliae]
MNRRKAKSNPRLNREGIRITERSARGPRSGSDRSAWLLDAWLAGLSALVLYLIVTRLRFDDPRWLYNGWTYAVAVPVVALALAVAFHGWASQYVQKSIQIGFMFSVFIHLLLLLLAVNVVVFNQFFPEAFTGVKPERSPIRKTVPEYLFQTPEETATTPDWSRPVEVETTSRAIPKEIRQLPPVENSAPKLEMPRPPEPDDRPMQKFLMKRKEVQEAQPKPADSPAKLARRKRSEERMTSPQTEQLRSPSIEVPKLEVEAVEMATSRTAERRLTNETKRQMQASSILPSRANRSAEFTPTSPVPIVANVRATSEALPKLGEMGLTPRQRARMESRSVKPAGASPSAQTVAIARIDEAADQMLSPVDVAMPRRGETQGAQLRPAESNEGVSAPSLELSPASPGDIRRRDLSALAGVPDVRPDASEQARPSRHPRNPRNELMPAGTPSLSERVATSAAKQNAPPIDEVAERSEFGPERRRSESNIPMHQVAPDIRLGPSLDVLSPESIAGLAERPDRFAGVVPSTQMPDLGSLEMTNRPRKRREIGGPVTPAGSEVAAVESFSRRVMRTQGGAAPTPAGMVGPATEEAIELGLTYLADTQNEDGSWSLAGHGPAGQREEVMMRSDTAATGLCLLAFQGAGYTHRQHQYADTVSRGLKFLLENQKTNGDLYRPEDRFSNQNVAFYSHGIAALALCEAYGMTQDDELKVAAQRSLDYIGNTQHARLGGWRYMAQVSSDTSVSGWMMMSLKSGELSGLNVPDGVYAGIDRWLDYAQMNSVRADRYRYDPFAADTPAQRHGREVTPTMTAVGIFMRMYSGWRRDNKDMQSAAEYLLEHPPEMGSPATRPSDVRLSKRDAYYWYYATQVMFHMGGTYWERWNAYLNPLLLKSQIKSGEKAGSWDPKFPVEDRWSPHGGRLYVTTMNLLNLEVYYRHLPIYDQVAE